MNGVVCQAFLFPTGRISRLDRPFKVWDTSVLPLQKIATVPDGGRLKSKHGFVFNGYVVAFVN